jgi:hypothetical protein
MRPDWHGPYNPMAAAGAFPVSCGLCPGLDRNARLLRLLSHLSQRQHEDAGHRGSWQHCRMGSCWSVRQELERQQEAR